MSSQRNVESSSWCDQYFHWGLEVWTPHLLEKNVLLKISLHYIISLSMIKCDAEIIAAARRVKLNILFYRRVIKICILAHRTNLLCPPRQRGAYCFANVHRSDRPSLCLSVDQMVSEQYLKNFSSFIFNISLADWSWRGQEPYWFWFH